MRCLKADFARFSRHRTRYCDAAHRGVTDGMKEKSLSFATTRGEGGTSGRSRGQVWFLHKTRAMPYVLIPVPTLYTVTSKAVFQHCNIVSFIRRESSLNTQVWFYNNIIFCNNSQLQTRSIDITKQGIYLLNIHFVHS